MVGIDQTAVGDAYEETRVELGLELGEAAAQLHGLLLAGEMVLEVVPVHLDIYQGGNGNDAGSELGGDADALSLSSLEDAHVLR